MKKAILFIHGFNGSYEEYKNFIEAMNHTYKIDTHYFNLPGHGEDKLGKVERVEWLKMVEEEYLKLSTLYGEVYVVGHSMGGILGTYLVSKYPEIKKLVLVSPAFEMFNFKQNMKDIKENGVTKEKGTMESFFKKLVSTSPYTFKELLKLVKELRPLVSKIPCPVLLIHGDEDEVVSIDASYRALDDIESPKSFMVVKKGKHKLLDGPKREEIEKEIYQFLHKKKYHKKYDYKEI